MIVSTRFSILNAFLLHILIVLAVPQSFDSADFRTDSDSDLDSDGDSSETKEILYDDYPMDYDPVGIDDPDPDYEDIEADIDCSRGRLPVWLNPLPYSRGFFPLREFDDLHDLCAYNGNPAINMHLRCDYHILPAKVVSSAFPLNVEYYFDPAIHEHCLTFCKCRHFRHPPALPDKESKCDPHRHHRESNACHKKQGQASPLMFSMDSDKSSSNKANPTCGRGCSSSQKCGLLTNGCRCEATRSFSNGPNLWRGACVALLSGSGRKRSAEELDVACPCNSTYVSRSCCFSDLGMVWEDESLRLGQLVPEDL